MNISINSPSALISGWHPIAYETGYAELNTNFAFTQLILLHSPKSHIRISDFD